MSTYPERLWRYLPAFMRPGAVTGSAILAATISAIGEEMRALADGDLRLLHARGAVWHTGLPPWTELSAYYPPHIAFNTDRRQDLRLIARSRLIDLPSGNTVEEGDIEDRLQDAIGLEVWDGTRERYTSVGDLSQYGTIPGMERELERDGLSVTITAARADTERWILRDLASQAAEPDKLNLSMMYELASTPAPGQRRTKLYTVWGWLWVIWVLIDNPQQIPWLRDVIIATVRLTKPAHVRAYVRLPGATEWEQVD